MGISACIVSNWQDWYPQFLSTISPWRLSLRGSTWWTLIEAIIINKRWWQKRC